MIKYKRIFITGILLAVHTSQSVEVGIDGAIVTLAIVQ